MSTPQINEVFNPFKIIDVGPEIEEYEEDWINDYYPDWDDDDDLEEDYEDDELEAGDTRW